MARISEQTIQQIASANDIVDVVGSYIPLKRAGAAYKALCPFHQEKTPSFLVTPSRQSFHCFGCGAGGSVFRFVMQYESVDFPAAARKLADRAGIRIIEEEFTAGEDRKAQLRRRLLALHAEATQWFQRNLLRTQAAQVARDYLKSRGVTADIAREWKLGYAPDSWDALLRWAETAGYTREELIRSGLVKAKAEEEPEIANPEAVIRNLPCYDRFRNRVMFPICNDVGETIGFSGRVLTADAKEAKYVNSPETLIFTKGNVLFGLHKSKRSLIDKNSAIVCEGQLDLITAFENGVKNVIAPQGTAFTDRQARLLKRFASDVILCFDADAAGMKAAERSLPSLLAVGAFVRVAEMPAGHDPDSLIRSEGAAVFLKQIEAARDFFDYQVDRAMRSSVFQTPRGKLEFTRKIAGFVSLVQESVSRDAIINQICARIDVPPSDFRRMLQAAPPEEPKSGTQKQAVTVINNQAVRLLCQMVIQSPEAQKWMQAQRWQELLSGDPDMEVLARLLAVPAAAGGGLHQFSGALSAADEALVSELAIAKLPGEPEVLLKDCWRELQRRSLRRRIEALKARIRIPNVSIGEIASVQKEILDLQKMLTDISPPFS